MMFDLVGGLIFGLLLLLLVNIILAPKKRDPLKDYEDEKNPDGI